MFLGKRSLLKIIFSLNVWLILFFLTNASCNTTISENTSEEDYTTWWSNPKGYSTTDLSIAQEETPFRIILPKYLPDDIKTSPVITGLAKDEFDDITPVTISYRGDGDGRIEIFEYNNSQNIPISAIGTMISYLSTTILEEESTEMTISRDGEIIFVPLCYYVWNRNEVHFVVSIYNYDHDIARKVIYSMIK